MNLFDKKPIVLDKDIAKQIGLNEAIILQQVHYWLEVNKKAKRNCHQGRCWTYNTIEEWTQEFPFWSKDTVKRTFKKLRKMGLIIVGNFNTMQMDRTLWYTIDYEKLEASMDGGNVDTSIDAKSSKDYTEIAPMEDSNLTQAIPENSTEITSEISTPSINQQNPIDRLDEYKAIIDKIELKAIDESYRAAVDHAIKLILIEVSSHKKIKIGNTYIPTFMIEDDVNYHRDKQRWLLYRKFVV